MRSLLLAILSVIIIHNCRAQVTASDYSILKKKGDSLLNRAGDPRSAAIVYSQILRLPGAKVSIWDFNRAAFSWSLSGYADSAFNYLTIISDREEVTFSDYLDIVDDRDYKSVHNDSRWKKVIDKIFENAQHLFHSILPNTNSKEWVRQQSAAIFAWAFNKRNLDSAFYFLSIFSASPSLTFEDVQNILTDGYTKDLRSDVRWNMLTNRMFAGLNTKYIPRNTFTTAKGKRIFIDEGHNNLHTIGTTYATLSGVLNTAGLTVQPFKKKFDESALQTADVVVISNPFGDIIDSIVARALAAKQPFRWADAASKSAYTKEEATAIEQWVKKGGSLLLILDHAPNPKAGQLIAEAFGINIRNVATYDRHYRDPVVDTTVATTIIFTRSKGLVGKHPILDGVDSVTTATGSSLVGPPQSHVLLYLPATASDRDWLPDSRQFRERPAVGRTQGVAFTYGKGRVVVLGEASMLNAVSTSVPNRGNWKMALNIFKWLTRNLL